VYVAGGSVITGNELNFGDGNVGTNLMIATMQAIGADLGSAAFWSRVPTNLIDKGIACAISWIILLKLPENMKSLSGNKKAA
jgi:hypothetical protein